MSVRVSQYLIDRLHSDRVLRVLCGWRYKLEACCMTLIKRSIKNWEKIWFLDNFCEFSASITNKNR